MLEFIIFTISIVIFFKIIGTAKKRADRFKEETFNTSYSALKKAQMDLSQRIEQSNLDPITAKKIFDKRTKSILRHHGLNAYGDETEIPLQQYCDFKDESRKLRKKFKKRMKV